MPSEINSTANSTDGLRQQVAEGLFYGHSRLNAGTSKTLEPTAFVYGKDACIWGGRDAAMPNPALERPDWSYYLIAETDEGVRTP